MPEPLEFSVEPHSFITMKLSGDLSGAALEPLRAAVTKCESAVQDCMRSGKKARILIDLADFSGHYDVQAMNIFTDFAKQNKDYVEKTAVFGGSPAATIAGKIIAAIATRSNIKFFKTKEEALGWLG